MRFLTGIILALLFSATVFAQGNGSLRGQIVDPNGAVIQNATVTANNNNGVEKTVTSSESGEFTITNLPAGLYTVRVNAATFTAYENAEVTIVGGQRAELTVTLTVAIEQQVVTVETENGVDTEPENNASATVLRDKDLEALPEDPDELAAALAALAGPSSGPNGGQFFIDGFTGGRLPPREAIREVRINSNPFSSEYDRPGFGRVEIFTKPGADRFRGQVFFNFNDESLNSRNPFAPNRASSQTRFFGGNLSGPIIKNKASFFIDVDENDRDDNAVINATILDQNVNQFQFTDALVVPRRRFSISPRLDYAINDRNTLIGRYSFQRNRVDNNLNGEQTLPSLATVSRNTEHNIQLTETAVISPTIINETRFQFNKQRNQQQGNNSIPTISVSGAFLGGGANIGLNFTDENRYELQNYTTDTIGKHTLKFGVRLRGINLENRSESNFAGTFSFFGIPLRFDEQNRQIDANGALISNPIRFIDGTIATTSVSSIEQYRQQILGNTDPRFNPTQFSITGGNPLADVSQTDFGVFLNDDWRVRPDLTLSLGLRYEAQTNVSNNRNFAPRVGFAYSPGAGGARQPKTVFRGGFGIFYDRISENLSLQEARFDGQRQLQYIVTDPALLGLPVFTVGGVTNVPTAQQIAAFVPGSSVVRRLAADLRSPYTMQSAISVERQLPYRTTLSFTFLNTNTKDLLRTRNVNAPVCPPNFPCPSTAALANALRPDPTTGNIYEFESTGRFNQQQFLINVNSRLSQGFTFNANYRLNRAKSDVDGGGGFGFGGGGAQAGGFPFYSYDLDGEYGSSNQNVRHFLFLSGSFTAPFNIRVSPIIFARSGTPFNITSGVDTNRDSVTSERPTFALLNARCEQLSLNRSFCDISNVDDANQFIPRNYGRGPATFNVNLNLTKTIGFGAARNRNAATGGPAQQQPEAAAAGQGRAGQPGNNPGGSAIPGVGGGRGGNGGGGRGGQGGGFFGQFSGQSDKPYNLTIGVQVSNLLNRTNLGTPISNLSSSNFGQFFRTDGGFGGGGGGSNAGNRQVRLQLRFSF